MSDSLPLGWARAPVRELTSLVQYGSSAKTCDDEAGVPVLRMGNIVGGRLEFGPLKYLPKGHGEFPELLLQPGDVLFNRTNSPELVGKTAVYNVDAPSPCSFASYLIRLRMHAYDPGLFAAYLNSAFGRAWVRSCVTQQVGQANVSGAKLKELVLPVPPLNEQRRIVAKLEALQARSRRAREALDAVPPLLEKLRQSILAAAFRGDLTKDWRAKHKDVEPASKLLERIRVERRRKWEEGELTKMKARGKAPADDEWKTKYEQPEPVDTSRLPELPDGWCVVELGAVVWRLTNGYVGATRDIYVEKGVPYLLSKHVKKNVLRFDGETFITADFNQRNRKSILKAGDVLLVQTGHVGESAVVPPEHEGHNCHAMIVISPVERVLDGNYLSLFFGAPATQRAFGAIEKGMTLRHLNCHDVIHLPTVVPPLEEQRAIVARAQARLADLAALASVLRCQSEAIGTLDRSVLAKAFRGELVAQDPNDEPADAMLARVRAYDGGASNGVKRAPSARRSERGAREPREEEA